MAGFDPNAYLAEKSAGSAAFDPDQYLSEKNSGNSDDSPDTLQSAGRSVVNSLPMIGGVAGGILGTPADAISGPMGSVVGAGIGGYLGTAAKNAINKYIDPQSAPSNAIDAVSQPISGGLEQAGYQVGGELAGKAISGAASWALPKTISLIGGVNKDVISEYLQNSKRINTSKSVDQLKGISDEFVGNMAKDLEDKNIAVSHAQEMFKSLKTDLVNKYQTMGYEARDALSAANQTLQDAHRSAIQDTAQDLADTIKQLQEKVSEGSAESYGILDKSGASLPVSPIKRKVTNLINQLKIAGASPVGDDAISASNQLSSIRESLNKFPKNIPVTEVKKMVQQLQRSTSYGQFPGTFSQAGDLALKDISSTLNSSLKSTIPEYASKMEEVSGNAGLLNKVSDFGDKASGAGFLSRINNPSQIDRLDAVKQLGGKFNKDFLSGINPESLPQYGLVQEAEGRLASLRPDVVKKSIGDQLASSQENSSLMSAQVARDSAQSKLDPFKSLAPNVAGQTQAQQKLLQLAKGKNIELDQMFSQLGKMTDTDFVQSMHDQNILSAFQKGSMNGSRNTLMGSLVGWMLGGIHGAVEGGAAGRAIDQFGPAITKKALDGAIAVSNSPRLQTISGLNLPAEIKQRMANGLKQWSAQQVFASTAPQSGLMAPPSAVAAPPIQNYSTVPGRNGH